MTKSQARTMAKNLTGCRMDTKDGTGVVNGVWTDQSGQGWIGVTIEGAGFNGSTLKTAIKVNAS